ncbi:MAG TPA: DUF5110 domain-containing protein, partial [Puia sp.]|nr:DUF5110 domain-containing protein [Puia sp.]
APYLRMPVYVKEGSILPLGPDLQYTGERPADTITLVVYTGKDAHFTLYEDEGINYNYEKGAFSTIPFIYSEASGTLTIGRREGSFEHMSTKRVFRIVKISKERAVALDDVRTAGKLVRYKGNGETVALVGMRQ